MGILNASALENAQRRVMCSARSLGSLNLVRLSKAPGMVVSFGRVRSRAASGPSQSLVRSDACERSPAPCATFAQSRRRDSRSRQSARLARLNACPHGRPGVKPCATSVLWSVANGESASGEAIKRTVPIRSRAQTKAGTPAFVLLRASDAPTFQCAREYCL